MALCRRYDARMRQFYLMFLLFCLALPGCGNKGNAPLAVSEKRVDLDDQYVIRAIDDYLAAKNGVSFSEYDFMRVDLDQDGWLDALVHLTAPYGRWCNMQGCSVLVFHAQETGFRLAGEIHPVRTPFYVGNSVTNGWRDLVVRVSGGVERARNVALRYDGRRYPRNLEDGLIYGQDIHAGHLVAFP